MGSAERTVNKLGETLPTRLPDILEHPGVSPPNTRGHLSEFFRWVFLPRGYPESVSSDYLHYQVWDTLQGFCGYLKGIILTLSFLKGLGIGSADGSLDSAMLVWIVRDTTGVVAGLLAGIPTFTTHFADRRQMKKWRLISEGIKAVSGVFEIISAYFAPPQYFMALACLVVGLNTVAGVMGSQTRSCLVTHFARCNNVSDCAAKEGNQDRGVKIFGIPLALLLLRRVGDHPHFPMIAYSVMMVTQFGLSILAVRSIRFDHDTEAKNHDTVTAATSGTGSLGYVKPVHRKKGD